MVKCPSCELQYRITEAMVKPLPDGPPDRPKATAARPGPIDTYALDEPVLGPPIAEPPPIVRPVAPPLPSSRPDADNKAAPAASGGIHLSTPVLIAAGIGVAGLSVLSAVGVFLFLRSQGSAEPPKPAMVAAPVDPSANRLANNPPEPSGGPAGNGPKGSEPALEAAPARPNAGDLALATPSKKAVNAPTPNAATPEPESPRPVIPRPAVAPPDDVPFDPADGITVAALLGVANVPLPTPIIAPAAVPPAAPELTGESQDATRARTAAAHVAADPGAGKPLSTADIVAESEPSVALIKGKTSSGTGFLVAPGLLATNAHVLADEFIRDLEVHFVSADDTHKQPLKAELLYEDLARDIAFLAVKTDLKPLRVAKTYVFRKGEDITVIGSPGLGDGQVLENAISRGVMSTKTDINGQSFYQLGIAINPGNSGGPVFDSTGRVIAIATLKSAKQESTGFGIPAEDLQAALGKMAGESASAAEKYRSQHRNVTAVKALGSTGALMCLMIDLRRVDAATNHTNAQVKEVLEKLEPVVKELDTEMGPSLTTAAATIRIDKLTPANVQRSLAEFAANYQQIRAAYSSRNAPQENQMRPFKQTHKRLLTDLAARLKLDVPPGLLVAFEDHSGPPTTIVPGNLGSYGSRLQQRPSSRLRPPAAAGGAGRPPSLRDRMRGRGNGR
jgi:S1-C subfamily serine protease